MSPMEKLRLQHQEILEIVVQIMTDLGKTTTHEQTKILLKKIKSLSKLLEEHLLLEDDFLYPALKKRPQENIRDIAHRFSIELGWIKDAYTAYIEKWISTDIIAQSTSNFLSESKAILKSLQQRIQKEDTELFPLIEKK